MVVPAKVRLGARRAGWLLVEADEGRWTGGREELDGGGVDGLKRLGCLRPDEG